jgi:hypothetical protein
MSEMLKQTRRHAELARRKVRTRRCGAGRRDSYPRRRNRIRSGVVLRMEGVGSVYAAVFLKNFAKNFFALKSPYIVHR